ncbi:MAG: hypothetical protein QOG10_6034 [Kribbellaceae bacterium]|nr:hypothetical protein [Kribbellaceae bacterium]
MNGKKETGSPNPWVKPQPEDEPDDSGSENQLPSSPWSQEVPPPPAPWTTPGVPADPAPPAGGGPVGSASGVPGGGPGTSFGGGPASETSAAWGDSVGAPSLRRPAPEPKRRKLPPLLIPIAAGVTLVALLAVALVLLTGGDNTADAPPTSPTSPTVPATATTPTPSTYSPPPNAIAVDFGVSVVPVDGWSVLAKETQGKELMSYAPNGAPRAFFWVRQKQNLTANTYLLRIVEGETQGEIAQLGNVRKLACPRDVLVECVAISYTSTADAVPVKGFVEAYRRKDGVVTAIDFRSRTDFVQKAEPDAETMKKSVIDSL